MQKTLKDLILELVLFTGEIDEKTGQKVPRTTYPKTHYAAMVSLKKRLMASLEFGVMNTEKLNAIKAENPLAVIKLNELTWVKTIPEDSTALTQRWENVDEELDLTYAEKEAVKYLYAMLDELPITDEDLGELISKL